MSTLRDLKLLPVWVNPQHLASTALHIMAGHRLRVVGVVEDHKLVGTIAKEDAVSVDPSAHVAFFMKPTNHVFDLEQDVRHVAERFVRENLDSAPVLEGEEFRGMVTSTMLLKELGRSFDPLTALPWSDRLREWGLEHLESGEEITVLFVDLDQFGQFNKQYGHLIGDQVLKRVANYLRESIDPETDLLVRYGGDEFAIGSRRVRDEAEALAERLRSGVADLVVDGAEEPISFSVGLHGGRRIREREGIHYGATLDNLINIASRNCIASKRKQPERAAEPAVPERPAQAFQILSVHADAHAERGVTTVILSLGGAIASGADPRGGKDVLESVAVATAKAVERAIPGSSMKISRVSRDDDAGDMMVEGTATFDGKTELVKGRSALGDDPIRATATATVEAALTARAS